MSNYNLASYNDILQFGILGVFILIVLYQAFKKKGPSFQERLKLFNEKQGKLDEEYKDAQPGDFRYNEYLQEYKKLTKEYKKALPIQWKYVIICIVLLIIFIFSETILLSIDKLLS